MRREVEWTTAQGGGPRGRTGAVQRAGGLVRLVLYRALAAPGLLVIRVAALLLAATLVVGVSLYSGAMGDAMLQATLARDLYNTTSLGTTYVALGTTIAPLEPGRFAQLDRYVRQDQRRDVGLPLGDLYVHHYTVPLALARVATTGTSEGSAAVGTMPLEYYEDLRRHVEVLTGRLDQAPDARPGDVTVAISVETARRAHLGLGDKVAIVWRGRRGPAPVLVVASIYRVRDPGAEFWTINNAEPFAVSLVVSRAADFALIASGSPTFSPTYFWRYRFPLDAVHLTDAPDLVHRLQRAGSTVSFIAPGAEVHTWLDQDINGFLYQNALLPVMLYVVLAPLLALIFYAIAVTAALILDRQVGEIALLRGRGASRLQVMMTYALEGCAVGAVATACSPLLGLPLAQLIGRSSGFLRFGGGLPMTLAITPATYLDAGLTSLFGLLASLLPAVAAARRTMLNLKRGQARAGQPVWQRLFLDVVLLGLALYGYAILRRQGPIGTGVGTAAVAQDPVLGLAPLAFAVSISMAVSRVLPQVATMAARGGGRLPSPSLSVALLSVARAPRQPQRLVTLLSLTISLGVFAATVAGVEESNLSDRQHYGAGTTLRLVEERYGVAPGRYVPLTMPVAWHRRLPGVHAASPVLRIASFDDTTNTIGDGTTVNVLGIDPTTAPAALWFRPDFAPEPLARLLGHLAPAGPNAIVSSSLVAKTGLRRGDSFTITLANGHGVRAVVAGVAGYFPTLDPGEGGAPFVLLNLAYLVQASHSPGPNEMWIKADERAGSVAQIVAAAHVRPSSLGRILDYSGVAPPFSATDNPLQGGVYGVASVGFLSAVFLALAGFFAYAHLSLARRLPEFAVLRALGLSPVGLRLLLLCEQCFLVGAGIGGGLLAGILTTVLFLPSLPLAQSTLPPYLITIPWPAVEQFVAALGAVFVAVLGVHVWMIMRSGVGRILRLTEA